MLHVAVRAEHLALRELGEDPRATPTTTDRIRDAHFLLRGIRVMKLQAPRVVFSAACADEPALELDQPFGDAPSSRQLRLPLTLHERWSTPLVFRARIPRAV